MSCKIGNPRLDETTELKFRDFLSNGSVGFNYPAGVVFDSQYDIVLSDAGASKLYVLFSHLIFLYYFHINDSDLVGFLKLCFLVPINSMFDKASVFFLTAP